LLPEKDKKICQICIEQRDFERLLEIVESFELKVRELSDMVAKYANANSLPDIEEETNVGYGYINDFCDEEFSI
jgi:hypothetical protein